MNFRKTFITVSGLFLLLFFFMGLTHYQVSNVTKGDEKTKLGNLGDYIFQFSELLMLTVQKFNEDDSKFITNDSIPNGVYHYNKTPLEFKDYYLLTSSESPNKYVIDLIDLENGESIKKWFPDLGEITTLTLKGENRLKKKNSINVINHPVMLKDSSIIGCTGHSLVKINRDSQIEWIKSNYEGHHSVEIDHDDKIWICGRRLKSKLPELVDKKNEELLDDLIMKIDHNTGDVLFEKSVIQILKDNNLYDLVFKNGNYEMDPIHLNDVQPALSDGDYWKKGDLLISPRHLSAIFLYRPSTNKILWYKQGPWLNQHDPDFLDQNKIVVFGNQIYRGEMEKELNHPDQYNSVFVYDFSKDSLFEPYKGFIKAEKIKTITEGRSEVLPNGDLFIEDSNNGRVFIGDTIRKKLSFSKRVNEEKIMYLHWSRIILN
ncbi:arylsulfotransferase family protein [Flavobacteriaceae bacterium]|nr:arylsulfotransferase family protein [Flavobacteriaceae bacterium]